MPAINLADHLSADALEAAIVSCVNALDAGWQPMFQKDIAAPCYSCGEYARVVSKDDDRWTMTILDHNPGCLHIIAEDRRENSDRPSSSNVIVWVTP